MTPLLHYQCPHCTGVFQVDPAMAGQQVACPNCAGVVAIGAIASEEMPPPAASYPWPPTHTAPPSAESPSDNGESAQSAVPPVVTDTRHATEPTDSAVTPPPTSAPGEQLACPHCSGAFQVMADMAGQQVACPHCGGVVTIPGETKPGAPAAPQGALLALRVQETSKKIVVGNKVVEVRRLTSEQKAARRLVKRAILICICGAILVGTMVYLSYRGVPWR